jgi:ribosomal protein S9
MTRTQAHVDADGHGDADVDGNGEGLHAQAQGVRPASDFAAAAALLQQTVGLGHVLSRADLADMLVLDGR